jgi:hypothetical protein
VFKRALAKDPEARYGSCRDFVSALGSAVAADAAATRIAPAPAPVGLSARRRRAIVAVVAAALLLFAAGALAGKLVGGTGRASAPPPLPARTVTVTVKTPDREAVASVAANDGVQLANTDLQLASALAELGRCDQAIPLLDRAQTLVGDQPRFDQLRAFCAGPAGPPGHRPGHHGNGHG